VPEDPVRLWRTNEKGERVLTELRRSMFPDEDTFQQALEFHFERGCEAEE